MPAGEIGHLVLRGRHQRGNTTGRQGLTKIQTLHGHATDSVICQHIHHLPRRCACEVDRLSLGDAIEAADSPGRSLPSGRNREPMTGQGRAISAGFRPVVPAVSTGDTFSLPRRGSRGN
jgi:hypothetical protein